MKQAMREHFRSCGRVEAFLSTYARLRTKEREHDADTIVWQYCDYCPVMKAATTGPSSSHLRISCPDQCELGTLFVAGWQEGQAQARQAFETGDLAIFEDIGRAAGFTSRRPLAMVEAIPQNGMESTGSFGEKRSGVSSNAGGKLGGATKESSLRESPAHFLNWQFSQMAAARSTS